MPTASSYSPGGALAEEGTHEELIGLQGIYEALWRVQSGEAVLQK
jgi:ABC-type multidrug transport system fused ATPase/permease subunit